MIGNDVVDLAAARTESNWQRRGFLEKLYSKQEQELIRDSATPEIMVWVLWSMKEAAYKIYNRETGLRSFIPHKLLCSDILQTEDGFTGIVSCEGHIYNACTIIKKNIIHTTAVTCKHDQGRITEIKNTPVVKDKRGIPYIYDSENKLQPVSVSHHGSCIKVVCLD